MITLRVVTILFFLATAVIAFEQSFVPKRHVFEPTKTHPGTFRVHDSSDPNHRRRTLLHMSVVEPFLSSLRGSGADVLHFVSSSLQPGIRGIATLWAVASLVVVPLTMFRRVYSISVGYGLSVMTMGMALVWNMPSSSGGSATMQSSALWLGLSIIAYGFRLGAYLFVREQASAKIYKQHVDGDKKQKRLQRIPLALAVSLFYAFMTTPALYALSGGGAPLAANSVASKVAYVGTGLAWLGAALEAIGDGQKMAAKWGVKEDDDNKFVGPTRGVYRICRHPNYLGEVLFWAGVCVSGAPSMGRDVVAWVCSALGLFGIVNIMLGSSKRLDKKQADKYKGQEKYEQWRKDVKASVIPFVNS